MSAASERNTLIVAVVAASIGVHLLLWPVSDRVLRLGRHTGSWQSENSSFEVDLIDEPEPDPDKPENRPDAPGQVVNVDRVIDERPPVKDTPYVSEFDSRVAHETRAPAVRPIPGQAQLPGTKSDSSRSPNQASADPAPSSNHQASESPGSQTALGPEAELAPPGAPAKSAASVNPPSVVALPSAAGTREALRKNLGQSGSLDQIGSDIDEGDETVLNSRRWKYASFFNRLRDQVAEHWHPEVVHASRDPEARIYGTKTRHTRLFISLNPDGTLQRIRLEASCGVDYLDEEAIHAVRAAAPFTNPPPGLVDVRTGLIQFGFGFIFEIRGERRIFRYQR